MMKSRKFLYILMFVSILPIIFMLIVSFYFSQSVMRGKISDFVKKDLVKTGHAIELYLTTYEKILIQTAINDNFVEQVHSLEVPDNQDIQAQSAMRKTLIALLYSRPDIRTVAYVSELNQVMFEQKKNYLNDTYAIVKYIESLLVLGDQTVDMNKVLYRSSTIEDGLNEKELLNIAVRIVDLNDFGLELGTLVISIDSSAFNIYCNPNEMNLSEVGDSNVAIIVDSKGNTIFSPASLKGIRPDEDDYIINTHHIEKYGWDLINITNKKEVFNEINAIQKAIIIIFLISICFEALLIAEVRRQGEQVNRAAHKQKEAEIRALEAQINPHFLYNTLDCINWVAIENDQHDISSMLKDLGNILRYSIDNSNHRVVLHEEIQWLEAYLTLQRLRFSDAFSYNITIDPKVNKFYIYKLLMQPFVENAIIHGFAKTSIGGVLSINISRYRDEYVLICIEDNGQGFTKDQLDIIRDIDISILELAEAQEKVGIGISNVMERLEGYYEGKAKLQISNRTTGGARVQLYIPIMKV